ncbi:P-loop containing nucleoside triphosphate hydrolase protein [Roridomyces roridus]|uniref:P-loop containing nucleoside triphosphate hydrolase protein n=1 Tax=Roridomyces roridus TaxID=1738132 RepID=A0AAD7FL10_9AGAR|nr:P-loop containing nucleoside triphosphate hydrolase protein [Roridomyces roridus]
MDFWRAQIPLSVPQASIDTVIAIYHSKDTIWTNSLAIPTVVAALSLTVLLGSVLYNLRRRTTEPEQEASLSVGVVQELKAHVAEHGGVVIFAFKLVRAVACLTLLGFSIASFALTEAHKSKATIFGKWGKKHPKKNPENTGLSVAEWAQLGICMTFLYASLLAVGTVFAKRKWSQIFVKHLNAVLIPTFLVYAARDLFPFLTYQLEPLDGAEGWILWGKIIALLIAALVVPLFIPRQYIPVDPKNPMPVANPEQTASIFSFIFYFFLDPIIFLAYRIPHLAHDQLAPNLEVSTSNKRHLFFGLIWTFRLEYTIMATSMLAMVLGNFASPIGLNRLLNFLEHQDEEPTIKPWFWILWLFFGPMLGSLATQVYIFFATRTLVRCEALITQLVFEHSLRIPRQSRDGTEKVQLCSHDPSGEWALLPSSSSSIKSTSSKTKGKGKDQAEEEPSQSPSDSNLVGKIMNLVTTDLGNIVDSRDFLFVLLLIPLEIVGCVIFYTMCLDESPSLAWVSWSCFSLCRAMSRNWCQTVQEKRLKKTDSRVQTVTEVLNVLRMLKMFGWERQMDERVAEKREEELVWIFRRQMLDLLNGTLNFFIPVATMLATFVTYTLIMIFSSMSVFDMLRNQLHFVFWALSQTVTGKVSLDRVNDFLRNTELLDAFTEKDPESVDLFVPADAAAQEIGFRDATFAWSSEKTDGTLTPSRVKFTLKITDTLLFQLGAINLVVGPTGSGKTSLLMALLGEMHFIPSGPTSWYNLPREKGVSYAAQEGWVQNETIKDNILFSAPWDEERYNKVIYQCALTKDLELFDAGDATEVGEKGLTLSGGQRARITLARAIYSSAEIILLDDILGGLYQVILVTHNVALAKPIATYVVSMKDGHVHSGPISEALATDDVLAEELNKDQQVLDKKMDVIDESDPPDATDKKAGKLIVAEEIEAMSVGMHSRSTSRVWVAIIRYCASRGMVRLAHSYACRFFIVFLFGLGASEGSQAVQTWFLGYWASKYDEVDNPADVDVFRYLGIYSSLLFAAMTIYAISYIFYTFGAFRASKTIHKQLVSSILGTTLRWLDTTPVSRIIARCTVDIRTIDGPISQGLWALLEMTVSMLVKFSAVILFTPVFFFPGVLVGVLGGWCGQIYIKAQLSVKREMSNAKAPVLGQNVTNTSVASIRAYGAQIDALGALFASGLAFYLVYVQTYNPSNAIGFSSMILWWVRVLNDFEVQGNSLERIRGYISIEQEPKPVPSGIPPAYWPASGKLAVEKLSARYSTDGPKVLHDISFNIKSGERVGVVGRTGSGKSSLTLALLRCIFTEGNVYYDGIPTSSLNLDALRSNITIIPQVPELLTGSLRKNIDLFDQYDDATLNSALRAAGLFSLQKDMEEGQLTLDSEISSGGGNLSVGQRQIIALARAIVRSSKLLILDEATSAIDYKTDSIIQASLRNELSKDTTLLTVAHRLQTIMDADKIMVLDAGRIVEFDSPKELLKIEDGMLRALVDESGDKDVLYQMANGTSTS